ncbi:hypothetical protein JCM3770_003408 [Rhodotorula araucariae]
MLPTLPAELLEQILADDSLNHSDLAACCLASRRTLHVARPRLYARSHLDIGEAPAMSSPQTRGWLSTVQAKPDFAALVRCLRLRVIPRAPISMHERAARGTRLQQTAEEILAPCNNLEHLDIGHTLRPPPVRFPSCTFLRSLHTVHLNDTGYALLLLLLLPHLQHLSVSATYFGDEPLQLHRSQPSPPFRLETLRILCDFEIVPQDVLATLVNHSKASLRALELHNPQTGQWLPTVPNVHTLGFNDYSSDVFEPALRVCPALRTIHIPRGAPHSAPPLASFSTASLPPTVRQLELSHVPSLEDLDALLGRLAPLGVRLKVFGVALPHRACRTGPRQQQQRSGPSGVSTSYAEESRQLSEQAHERRRVLKPFCAERGIALVESRDSVLPSVYCVRG